MQSDPSPTALVDGVLSVAAHLEPELDEALAEHRLTRPSFQVLSALLGAEGNALTQRELMATVRRTSGTMSVRLARLERAGLVAREPDPGDRRTVTVTLTERGREWATAARPAYEEAAERLVSGLPDEARAAFAEHLAAWLAFFEPDDRVAPRLGVVVAPAAVASRMRRAVGLAERPGVLVLRVKRSSAADEAGLQRGDLIVGAGGTPVRSAGDVDRALRKAGATLKLDLVRGVEERSVEVALDSASAPPTEV
ncbi:MAG TPA: MarR family transcriptional regulator [Solirubrobacteraceae bacterium]